MPKCAVAANKCKGMKRFRYEKESHLLGDPDAEKISPGSMNELMTDYC